MAQSLDDDASYGPVAILIAALQDEHWAETIILVGSTVLPSTVGGLL